MSWLSSSDASTLRSWLDITIASYSDGVTGIPMPGRPVGQMLIVYLSLQPSETATYAAFKAYCQVDAALLTEVLRPLKARRLVASTRVRPDGRVRRLRLMDQGRAVVGEILNARSLIGK